MATIKIDLTSPKTIREAVVISSVTLERIVDLPSQKIVRAFVAELSQPLVLWSGATYDAAGDWTQAQANARLATVVNALTAFN